MTVSQGRGQDGEHPKLDYLKQLSPAELTAFVDAVLVEHGARTIKAEEGSDQDDAPDDRPSGASADLAG